MKENSVFKTVCISALEHKINNHWQHLNGEALAIAIGNQHKRISHLQQF